MDSGVLAHTLKPLERDGFVAIAVDSNDRRNWLISLTRKGQAKLVDRMRSGRVPRKVSNQIFGQAKSNELRKAMKTLISDGFMAAFENAIMSH